MFGSTFEPFGSDYRLDLEWQPCNLLPSSNDVSLHVRSSADKNPHAA